MTFARVNPFGWTDDIATITAAHINGIDINQSRAIDGNAGGAYTPSGVVEIDGSGFKSDNIGDSTVTGAMDAAATGGIFRALVGGFLELRHGANIADTDNLTLDPADGLIREFATQSGDRDHDLVAAGNDGRFLWLVAYDAVGRTFTIRRSGFAGASIVAMNVNPWSFAVLRDNGTNWRLLGGYSITPGTLA